ncbi:hypothetical protein CAPTEDRAFT_146767 [Capitella teleta]|uniref:U2A'/phosphoprotein 32 family A C-terminal domain-containing protein n=1 Tax=Capitella teleta TaxID=283909 RepID=R7TL79_CAPTE|nr:hypothetical protein CAPTEDRAFT_146767 [Capitella teleta]|eukprot:ELT94424.1 hypothetical protein CAPTEDRAFT_146767 [Capitella teleta]
MEAFGRRPTKRISLAYQNLVQVPDKILKSECGFEAEELDLTSNKITSNFTFLLDLPFLHTLILDRNGITSHAQFPQLSNIQTLWVNHNKISNLGIFITRLCKSFPNLRHLSMMNNEAAPSYFNGGTFMQYKDYRHYVISHFPDLITLDDGAVDKQERSEAERIYASIVPARRPSVK